MRTVASCLLFTVGAALAALSGCIQPHRPEPTAVMIAPAPPEPDPFEHGSTSFMIRGPRFTPGESAIVKVCVSPSGVISSADLIGSSGDKRFDDFALVWARQVKLASPAAMLSPTADSATPAPKDVCGSVRVEIRAAPAPSGIGGGHDSGLG